MKQARLVLANDRFGRSAAGLVYGGLCLRIEDVHFPDSRWTDFVVVVLSWWCVGLSRLLGGEQAPFEVRFMEGPYLVEIGPKDARSMHLKLVEAGLSRRIRLEAEVSTDTLIESVVAAAARALAECKARNWWSDDADRLVDAMEALERDKLRT